MKFLGFLRTTAREDHSPENQTTRRIVIAVLSLALPAALALGLLDINRTLMFFLSLLVAISLALALRGFFKPATALIPSAALIIFGYLMFYHQGIRDMAVLGLPVVIVSASLMNRRGIGTIIFGALSMCLIVLLWYAEKHGYAIGSTTLKNTDSDFIAALVAIAMVTALEWVLINRLNANIQSAQRELAERNRVEAALRQREAILSAVARAAQRLLEASDWREYAPTLLADLGAATNASHAYIFENHADEGGIILTSQKFEWGAPDVQREIDNPRFQNVPVREPGTEDWYNTISQGKVYYSTTGNFPVEWRAANPHIKTLLDMPIMAGETWWGVIGFDDCTNELGWSQAEVDALMAAAKILGTAIQRQQADQALRASEDKFQKAFHHTFVPMIIGRLADQKIIDVNQAFCTGTGYHRDEIIGHTGDELDIWVNNQARLAHLEALRTSGQVQELKTAFRTKNGDVGTALISATLINLSGEACVLYTLYDVTNLEVLLKELRVKNDELERFTYTVSHDLKAPLITIRGFLGYLEQDARKGDWPRLQDDMKRIVEATDRMQQLLNELLELSRVGRITAPSEIVSFEDITRESIRLLGGRLSERNITVEIASGLPSVRGERLRLVEVMQNLIDNAIKFMGEQPEPRIEVGGQCRNEQYVFHVKDNGIGIQPKHMDKIFGLFDKLDPHTEGTGIGLAIVKRIVELHGGKIWAESEPGQGTSFYFTLALADNKAN